MTKIHFVDQTIRDAQQSLWAFMMRTDMIVPVAHVMDQVGYKAIATVGSQGYVVEVRNLNEDPWERVKILSESLTRTPLRGSYMTTSLASFDINTPRDIIALWIRRSVANGIKSFWVCDYQNDMEKFCDFAKLAKSLGAEVVPALLYTISPAHTRKHWAMKTRLITEAKDCIDAIMIEDAGGMLTPESTRELVVTVQQNCDEIPLEFHSHCNSGLAPLCYLEAVKLGVTTVHTAVSPLANGTSLPATETILKNIKRLGFTSDINEDALAVVSEHFRKIAEKEGLPVGIPMEYDLFHLEHQVPGGMMTNLKRQLKELGMEDRLDEILEEIVAVRQELGYPIMATPFSQIVGAQAFENVIQGERYKQVPDETIKYVLGYYGDPVAPIDRKVVDVVMRLPRAKEFLDRKGKAQKKTLEEIRTEIGEPGLSEDELLLRVLIPGKHIKKEGAKKQTRKAILKTARPSSRPSELPKQFKVEVDGDVFNVKIFPLTEGPETVADGKGLGVKRGKGEKVPPGAVQSGMAGMVLSIPVKEGHLIGEGDLLATIEAMKMIRRVLSPDSGRVKEVFVKEGDIVEPDDVLMVIE